MASRALRRGRAALCAAAVWAILIASTQAAQACPACAGREDGGVMRGLLLGTFIFFPFAVVAVVVRFIRAAGDDTAKSPHPPVIGTVARATKAAP